jgi:hypothetical protein
MNPMLALSTLPECHFTMIFICIIFINCRLKAPYFVLSDGFIMSILYDSNNKVSECARVCTFKIKLKRIKKSVIRQDFF